MSDPSFELQASLLATLKGVSPSIAGARIFDQPPKDPTFPYVTIGDCQVLPTKFDAVDGAEVYPQIDVWSRAVGYPEAKTITKQVMAALDEVAFSVTGFRLVVFEFQSVQYLRDPDGLTRHAAITFRGLLEPA